MKLTLNSTKVKFNVPSHGILQKSHPDSIITHVTKGSEAATRLLLNSEASIWWAGKNVEVTVLQATLVDETFICEVLENSKI